MGGCMCSRRSSKKEKKREHGRENKDDKAGIPTRDERKREHGRQNKDHKVGRQLDSTGWSSMQLYAYFPSQSWVYAKFTASQDQDLRRFDASNETVQKFYAINLRGQISIPFPEMEEGFLGSATAVLRRNFYVIGGENHCHGTISNQVSVCDLSLSNEWSSAPPTKVPRRNGIAIFAGDGRLYIFGGCPKPKECESVTNAIPWAEMYDPDTKKWTDLPACDDPPLEPLVAVALPNRIFIRGGGEGNGTGIELHLLSLQWSRLPDELIRFWPVNSSAAALDGILVTMNREERDDHHFIAYNFDRGAWLRIDGPRISYYKNAALCCLFSLNSNLVICDICDSQQPENDGGLRFSVFEIKEEDENSLVANFVSEFFPRSLPLISSNMELATVHTWSQTGAHAWSATGHDLGNT